MPVFHTKTIESILDPFALQVSKLVIIHEEGEAGMKMPDLEKPVETVAKAVINLVKAGREMVSVSEDVILMQNMPDALQKVEDASLCLEEAAFLSHNDPFSKQARTKLIEGSRWILQGTSDVLMVFDESQVRKILVECRKVLDYLSVTDVIETMDDLVQFVKDISPCLSHVTKEVHKRTSDLTHQKHRQILLRCMEQIKTLAPILICSMKIAIQIIIQGGKGIAEATSNRNYLTLRMSEELMEVIRVLQLTTYEEQECESDSLKMMRRTENVIKSHLTAATDWLRDPMAENNSVGKRSLMQLLQHASKLAQLVLTNDAQHLIRLVNDVKTMAESLSELRMTGQAKTLQAEAQAKGADARLSEMLTYTSRAINRVEKSCVAQPAFTIVGRLDQASRWLSQPGLEDSGLGRQALNTVLEDARKISELLPNEHRKKLLRICSQIDEGLSQLSKFCREGLGNSPSALSLGREVAVCLGHLKESMQISMVCLLVNNLLDVEGPLKRFTEFVIDPNFSDHSYTENDFRTRADSVAVSAEQIAQSARMVAVGNLDGNRMLAESLIISADRLESLAPQLISAGHIRLVYPGNEAADDHFENLRSQYTQCIMRIRGTCDAAINTVNFISQSAEAIMAQIEVCESGLKSGEKVSLMTESVGRMIRLSQRVVQLLKQEAENSEDGQFVHQINRSNENLEACISTLISISRNIVENMKDPCNILVWRQKTNSLLEAVREVHEAVASPFCVSSRGNENSTVHKRIGRYLSPPEINSFPDLSSIQLDDKQDTSYDSSSEQDITFQRLRPSEYDGPPGPAPNSWVTAEGGSIYSNINRPYTRNTTENQHEKQPLSSVLDTSKYFAGSDNVDNCEKLSKDQDLNLSYSDPVYYRELSPKNKDILSSQQQNTCINLNKKSVNTSSNDFKLSCVKDLVALIEKNTKSETCNPYVRKWGCDLMSPEPRLKNVTYRQEKRDYDRRPLHQRNKIVIAQMGHHPDIETSCAVDSDHRSLSACSTASMETREECIGGGLSSSLIYDQFESGLDLLMETSRSVADSPYFNQSHELHLLPKSWVNDDNMRLQGGSIPPRPPLPPADLYADPTPQIAAISSSQCDTTDDEADDIFLNVPIPSQGPIMTAARDLHQEVTQWSSKDNDIIVAAKRMALLMAKLSKLVSQDMRSSQRDLIACAKEIAKSSSDVTRIATDLAKECSDKRIRMNLLQVCERIPTIATQLKILSTVKATMLGCQGSKEDQEATDMIVGNAQNLMQSVKLTVTASESASIKIRTAAGVKLVWVRKHPWYIY